MSSVLVLVVDENDVRHNRAYALLQFLLYMVQYMYIFVRIQAVHVLMRCALAHLTIISYS